MSTVKVFCFILVLWCAAVDATEINLLFLRNQSDLTTSYRVHAFFCCNVIGGPNLSWEIRGQGIGVFDVDDDLDRVIARNRSDYSYIATMLSRRNGSSLYNFDSVLVVSISNYSSVEVRCVSDSYHNGTSNLENPHSHDNSGFLGSSFLYLLPVLNSRIVTDTVPNVYTRVFVCASSGQDQLWTTDMNDRIGFDSGFKFGSHRSRPTTNKNRLRLQAVSLGQHNQHLISILYLSDNAVVSLGCSANNTIVVYQDVSGVETEPDIVGITRVGSDGIPSSGSFQIEAIRYFMAVSMMMMFVLVA